MNSDFGSLRGGALLAVLLAAACDGGARTRGAAAAGPTSARQSLNGVVVTSLPSVPGWQVAESRGGFYCEFFQYAGTGDYAQRLTNALKSLADEGKKLKADAFVNARLTAESHEIQGSKWHASIVHVCGDFVVLK